MSPSASNSSHKNSESMFRRVLARAVGAVSLISFICACAPKIRARVCPAAASDGTRETSATR